MVQLLLPHQLSYRVANMKDIQELLRQKERRIQQLRVEIEALRVAAPMLASPGEAPASSGSGARPDNKVDISSYLSDANS